MAGVTDARLFARLGIQTYGFTADEPAAGLRLLVDHPRRRRARSRRARSSSAREAIYRALERYGERRMPETRWALTLPFAGDAAARPPAADRARRGGRLRRPLERRDQRPGRLHAAGRSPPPGRSAMRLGTGVVNAFTRGPAVLAQHAAALQDASGGRFCLGIGSSSNVIVERWNEIPFEKPLTKVRETVEALRAVLAGERGPGRLQARDARPIRRRRSTSPRCASEMLRLGGRARRRHVRQLPARCRDCRR